MNYSQYSYQKSNFFYQSKYLDLLLDLEYLFERHDNVADAMGHEVLEPKMPKDLQPDHKWHKKFFANHDGNRYSVKKKKKLNSM